MDMKNPEGWELFSDELVFESPVFKIRSGPVVCKRSGRKKNFYKFDFPHWVNIIAITEDEQLLLIKQYRYGSNQVELEIPGGVMEEGESPEIAGCRELLEECGYAGENARVIGKVNPNPAVQENYCYTVLVENARKVAEQNMDDMEDIAIITRPKKDVLEALAGGTLDISHGLVLNALSFFQNLQGK